MEVSKKTVLNIAHEAYMMGRVYSHKGEKASPVEDVQRMVEMVNKKLQADTPRSTFHRIKKDVARQFGVPVEELPGPSRKKRIVQARRIAMKRCRTETGATLEEIGEAFGRDHATVLYNLKNRIV